MAPKNNVILRNAANIVSVLGVLPLCVLLGETGILYLIPLIVFNNVMDDLDGVLAIKLDIKSNFGAVLDNVCDTVAHAIIALAVGVYYWQHASDSIVGGACLAGSLLATTAILLRTVARLDPALQNAWGSPTNELIRHIMLLVLVSRIFQFDPSPLLIATFVVHAATMLAPFQLPYLLRSLSKSATAIGLLNVSLVVAWLAPYTTPFIAAAFFGSYLVSTLVGLIGCFATLGAQDRTTPSIGERRSDAGKSYGSLIQTDEQ